MDKFLSYYGKSVRVGMESIIVLVAIVGSLVYMSKSFVFKSNDYSTYKDTVISSEISKRNPPTIEYDSLKQIHENISVQLSDYITTKDAEGNSIKFKVESLQDENKADVLDTYNQDNTKINFCKAGIYTTQIKAVDSQKKVTRRVICISVNK